MTATRHDPDGPFGGVWNIVPTPFTPSGDLDVAGVRRVTEFVLGTGVDGLTVLGVMGEAHKLSDAERSQVIEATVSAANGRRPVCVGVSHAATDRAVAFAREAAALGAHSVMLAPPQLAKPTDGAIRRHYLTVAAAIDLPIVVQDYPPASGVQMSVELIAALAAEAPTCRTLKLEDEPSPPKVAAVLAAEPRIAILGGLGAIMLLEELRAGAAGTMTGFGFPEVLIEIVARFRTGDEDGARDVFYRHLPLIRFENQPGINLPLRKHLYRRRGAMASERARSPVAPLDAGTMLELDRILHHLGLAAGLGPIAEDATKQPTGGTGP
ncbi:MAG TPA: dihydrodipicolinate synthase family protein [Candidatus Limnocylindrales bacterium]